MILSDYRATAFVVATQADPSSRQELTTAVAHALFAIDVDPKQARKEVATLLDGLRETVKENGAHAPSAAWVPLLQYLVALHASHPQEGAVTAKNLQNALEELQAALTP